MGTRLATYGAGSVYVGGMRTSCAAGTANTVIVIVVGTRLAAIVARAVCIMSVLTYLVTGGTLSIHPSMRTYCGAGAANTVGIIAV